MIDEAQYPKEFQRFKSEFVQMRVDTAVATGGDGEATRIAVEQAFAEGWRPPQQFEMWIRGRANLPLVSLLTYVTYHGTKWTYKGGQAPLVDTQQEAEDLAFKAGFRLE